jgi:hypothetical protein
MGRRRFAVPEIESLPPASARGAAAGRATGPAARESAGPDQHLATEGGARTMAKLHARPSLQYRYEHYDPWM